MSHSPAATSLRDSWDLRGVERRLLLACLVCVSLGFLMVLGAKSAEGQSVTTADLQPVLLYAASLLGVHLAFVVAHFRGDCIVPAVVALLAGLGLLAQSRMGTYADAATWARGQYVLAAGILVMVAVAIAGMRGRYRTLGAGPWVWGALSLLVIATVLATGQRFRGGVYAAGFITPTEILKVTVVLFLAGLIDRRAKALGRWHGRVPLPPLRDLLPLIGFWALLSGLLALQRDLGMLAILSVTLIAMLVIGTRRIGYLGYGVGIAAALGYLALGLFQHGQKRVDAWLSPFQDPTGDSWQVLQGLSGMYSGGLWGEGFGQGNPEYTPIAESDFIYSVIGEELGFAGCAILVVFFLVIFTRALQIAARTRSTYGALVSAGLTTVLATQTFLNIGGVTKLIPLTGVTLPFISHGGSSLLTAFASLGLVLAISDGEPAQGGRRSASPSRAKPRRSPVTKVGAGKRARPAHQRGTTEAR